MTLIACLLVGGGAILWIVGKAMEVPPEFWQAVAKAKRIMDDVHERVYPGASRQQPLETIAAVVRGPGLETSQRRVARRGVPGSAADAGAAGEIELPAVRCQIRGQRRTSRPRPEAVLIDTTPLAMPLAALGAIEIQSVRRTADEPLFHSLMEQFHYLRYEQPVGEHLKYLVWAQGRPVACLAWSSAPRHLASRDRFIDENLFDLTTSDYVVKPYFARLRNR